MGEKELEFRNRGWEVLRRAGFRKEDSNGNKKGINYASKTGGDYMVKKGNNWEWRVSEVERRKLRGCKILKGPLKHGI